MKIIARYGGLDVFQFEGSVVWRTVGIESKPERISELVCGEKEEIVRIHAALSRGKDRRSDARNLTRWGRSQRRTRYSDGSVPVVYTSKEYETSVAERFHWAFVDCLNAEGYGEFTLKLELLTFQFDGPVRSLVDQCPPCVDLVHPDDYSCCIAVGKLAFDDCKVEGLLVPSARRDGGINLPLFTDNSVGAVIDVNDVTVFFDTTLPGAEAHLGEEVFRVSSDAVYERVSI